MLVETKAGLLLRFENDANLILYFGQTNYYHDLI